jgi:hypothetical protein
MSVGKQWSVRTWSATLFLIGCLVACNQPSANVAERSNFNLHGIEFQHPKNWSIESETLSPDVVYLNVETGGSATFIVLVQPEEGAPSLLEYANNLSQEAAVQTPSVLRKQSSKVEIDASNKNRATQTFSMSLLGVDVPHQVEYRRIPSPDTQNKRVAFLMWQTAVEDASKTTQGASLVFDSFNFTQ